MNMEFVTSFGSASRVLPCFVSWVNSFCLKPSKCHLLLLRRFRRLILNVRRNLLPRVITKE